MSSLRAAFKSVPPLIAVVLSMASESVAQIPEVSPFDHACPDCHLRRHQSGPDLVRLGGAAVFRQGVSQESEVCLACHFSPQARAEQARPGRHSGPVGGGKYLGPDLADDHVLGRPPPRLTPRPDVDNAASIWWLEVRRRGVQCADCHQPHPDRGRRGVSTDERVVCSECHDPGIYVFEGHVTPTCGDCHSMHDGHSSGLLRILDSDALCSACHEDGGGGFFTDAVNVIRGPRGHDQPQLGRCVDCHRIHGTSRGY